MANRTGTGNFNAGGIGRRAPVRRPVTPHFVLFQGDDFGIDGWSPHGGGRKNRWDTLLDSMLKCIMMDGQWAQEVRASLFVGADAIHLSGCVQPLIMPVCGFKPDGRPMYQPATVYSWEQALWKNIGQNHPGLTWELDKDDDDNRIKSGETCQQRSLRRLDRFLEDAPEGGCAIALDYRNVDSTWDRLKLAGNGRDPKSSVVYLLLGGAHGFDGRDDNDPTYFDGVVQRFKNRFGKNRVARVNLCEEPGDTAKFTAVKVAAFLSVEYSRKMIPKIAAGLEHVMGGGELPNRSLASPTVSRSALLKLSSPPSVSPPALAPWARKPPETAKNASVAAKNVSVAEVAVQTEWVDEYKVTDGQATHSPELQGSEDEAKEVSSKVVNEKAAPIQERFDWAAMAEEDDDEEFIDQSSPRRTSTMAAASSWLEAQGFLGPQTDKVAHEPGTLDFDAVRTPGLGDDASSAPYSHRSWSDTVSAQPTTVTNSSPTSRPVEDPSEVASELSRWSDVVRCREAHVQGR